MNFKEKYSVIIVKILAEVGADNSARLQILAMQGLYHQPNRCQGPCDFKSRVATSVNVFGSAQNLGSILAERGQFYPRRKRELAIWRFIICCFSIPGTW